MSRFDIAIAGCGIAGLSAALFLHRQGHRVTIYERFDAPRPVGSGLMIQPTGLAVLDALGLAGKAVTRGAAIKALHGLNAEGEPVLEASYADLGVAGLFGLGIHRATLFAILHEALCAEGIAIRTSHQVVASTIDGPARRLIVRDREERPAHDMVVDCLGLSSTLADPGPESFDAFLPFGALWCTLRWPEQGPFDPHLLEQRYRNAAEMVGVLPTGERETGDGREFSFFWSLRQQDHAQWQSAGLASWKTAICALWPECEAITGQIEDAGQMVFARYAHRSLGHPVADRLIHIGDAWHSASPQLGQGANMALLDAWALACAMQGEGSLQQRLEQAIALRRAHVRLYQWLTAAFTPLYQSSSVWPAALRDLILAPLSRLPPGPRAKAMLVAGLAGDPLRRLGLAMPDFARFKS